MGEGVILHHWQQPIPCFIDVSIAFHIALAYGSVYSNCLEGKSSGYILLVSPENANYDSDYDASQENPKQKSGKKMIHNETHEQSVHGYFSVDCEWLSKLIISNWIKLA